MKSFFIADVNTTVVRTPSPGNRVEFFIDNQKTSQRSVSPGLIVDNIIENPEQEKVKFRKRFFLKFLFIYFF
jgi:hypothetical protein